MKRSFDKFAIFVAIVLMCNCVSASHIVKRDDEGTGIFETIINYVSNFPIVGSSVANFVQMIQTLYNRIQELTNGALGRILGGALPCTIDFNTRLTCTGVTAQSSLSELVRQLLDPIPSLILPGIIKAIIYLTVDGLLMPSIDTFFGGMRISR